VINNELSLLVKSKYPVIFFESLDENHAIVQLKALADELDLIFYHWSLTDGLRRGDNKDPYYQSKEPTYMMHTVKFLTNPPEGEEIPPGLFVLKDFERHLENVLVLRLFKDVINNIRNTKNTIVILAPEYKLPKDIESDSAHIIGGYPVEDEIETVIKEMIKDLRRTHKGIDFSIDPGDLKTIINGLKGLSIQQIKNIINQCVLHDNMLTIKDLSAIELYKRKIFDQEGLLEYYLSENRQNIAGFHNLKRWLRDRRDSFTSNSCSSIPYPKGILLMGVQGCGKSLAIKVIARELNLPLYRLDLARLYSKYIGETEQNLRKALNIVDKLCPLCLWIDEIEKGFAASSGDIDGGVSQRILGTFLTWMQERKSACFLAATANDIYQIPPEFLRKGRFDEIFFVDLPDVSSREEIFKIHFVKRGLSLEDFDYKRLAAMTEEFSGAEIEQAIISALYRSSSRKEPLSTKHIIEQIKSTKPLAILKREDIMTLRAWAKERTVSV
jgi:SpoVK/Ycf46/Vps4 family AAA+-type ATPase